MTWDKSAGRWRDPRTGRFAKASAKAAAPSKAAAPFPGQSSQQPTGGLSSEEQSNLRTLLGTIGYLARNDSIYSGDIRSAYLAGVRTLPYADNGTPGRFHLDTGAEFIADGGAALYRPPPTAPQPESPPLSL